MIESFLNFQKKLFIYLFIFIFYIFFIIEKPHLRQRKTEVTTKQKGEKQKINENKHPPKKKKPPTTDTTQKKQKHPLMSKGRETQPINTKNTFKKTR